MESFRNMVKNGLMWKRINEKIPLDSDRPIEMLSERNIRILKDKIGCLTEEESCFMNRTLSQPWYLTYFSSDEVFYNCIRSADGTACLKSYDKRKQEKHGLAVSTSASPADIEQFANTDFIFFCLEIGNTLKKGHTRSPGRSVIIRTSLDQDLCAMSMHGDIFDGLRAGKRIQIPKEDLVILNRHLSGFEKEPLNDDNGFARTVFYGINAIKEGTVLQVILDLRHLRESVRSEILTRRGSRDLNDVVTSMSRTQVMVPEECILSNYQLFKNPSGFSQYSSTEASSQQILSETVLNPS